MNSSSISTPSIAARANADAIVDRRSAPRYAVAFDHVARSYGEIRALVDVDLTIGGGSTVALLGPNGAGKSTAIGLMLGLLHPDGGSVGVLGLPPRAAVEAGRVGAMFQVGGLPIGVTVAEIVDFARRLYPNPMTLDTALARSGLTAFARRRTEDLSGDETQRLRFALSVLGRGRVVVMPESMRLRRLVERHPVIGRMFPVDALAVRRWLRTPAGTFAGLWFLSDIDPKTVGGATTRPRHGVRA